MIRIFLIIALTLSLCPRGAFGMNDESTLETFMLTFLRESNNVDDEKARLAIEAILDAQENGNANLVQFLAGLKDEAITHKMFDWLLLEREKQGQERLRLLAIIQSQGIDLARLARLEQGVLEQARVNRKIDKERELDIAVSTYQKALSYWNTHGVNHPIKNAGHTGGRRHLWNAAEWHKVSSASAEVSRLEDELATLK